MVTGHKSAAGTYSPDGGTDKMCIGGGMHCPSSSTSGLKARLLPCFVLSDEMEKSSDCGISDCGQFTVEGLRAIARGFQSFADIITRHPYWTATEHPTTDADDHSAAQVFDSWPEKLAAWRAALYVGSVVLHADLEIVATSSKSQSGGSLQQPGRLLVGHL